MSVNQALTEHDSFGDKEVKLVRDIYGVVELCSEPQRTKRKGAVE